MNATRSTLALVCRVVAVAVVVLLIGVLVAPAIAATSHHGVAAKLKEAAQDRLPASMFACVSWDSANGADRPIRFVVNKKRAVGLARSIAVREKAKKLTRITVARQPYSYERQMSLALRLQHEYIPKGSENYWNVYVDVEDDANDAPACPRVLVTLIVSPGVTISDETRAWANAAVAKYGSDHVKVQELVSNLTGPGVYL